MKKSIVIKCVFGSGRGGGGGGSSIPPNQKISKFKKKITRWLNSVRYFDHILIGWFKFPLIILIRIIEYFKLEKKHISITNSMMEIKISQLLLKIFNIETCYAFIFYSQMFTHIIALFLVNVIYFAIFTIIFSAESVGHTKI